MIDIALIMGIVGAAVGVIIGIVIYSEVSDATFARYSTTITNIEQEQGTWNSTNSSTIGIGTYENNSQASSYTNGGSTRIYFGDGPFTDLPAEAIITEISMYAGSGGSASGAVLGIYDSSFNLIQASNQNTNITSNSWIPFTFNTDPVVPINGQFIVGLRANGVKQFLLEGSAPSDLWSDDSLTSTYPAMDATIQKDTQISFTSRWTIKVTYLDPDTLVSQEKHFFGSTHYPLETGALINAITMVRNISGGGDLVIGIYDNGTLLGVSDQTAINLGSNRVQFSTPVAVPSDGLIQLAIRHNHNISLGEEKLHVGPDVNDYRNNWVGEPTSSSYSLDVSEGDVFVAIEQKYSTNQISHNGGNGIFGLYDQSNNLLVKTEVKSVPDNVGITTIRFNFEGGSYVIPAGVTSVRGIYLSASEQVLQGYSIGTITRGGYYGIPNMPDPYSVVGTVCTGCAITHKLVKGVGSGMNFDVEYGVGGGIFEDQTPTTTFPNMDSIITQDQQLYSNIRWYAEFEYITENEIQTVFTGRDAAPEEHIRADGIAVTVLTLIPISMFFGLFAIFGGFKNNEIS